METGFLNPIHDEEHFTSTFYNQTNVLDDSEHMLFGEMIVPEIVDYEYDNLWHSVDDVLAPGHAEGTKTRQDDFQKMLFEWQHQLNSMQEPESIKQIVPVAEQTEQEISEMFAIQSSSVPTDPFIDELFPLESGKDTSPTDNSKANREEDSFSISETMVDSEVKYEKENPGVAAFEVKFQNKNMVTAERENVKSTVATTQLIQEPILPLVNIKVEREEPVVDVESVEDEIPLLMAKDLDSLLEQFEATEKVNAVQPILAPPSPPRPSSRTIRDALPAEVINRIKASREHHKKKISVIPAIPSKKLGRAATRMQDAGVTLSRNKLLKLVTGGAGGETVQLDHDYCNSGADSTSNSFYVSDSSEYPSQSSTPEATYSRMPDYLGASLALLKPRDRVRIADTGSKKDSGLESGENSDDEITPVTSKVLIKSGTGLKSINVVTENGVMLKPTGMCKVPMVSVLKKNIKVENDKSFSSSGTQVIGECLSPAALSSQEEEVSRKKKKKLNLEEYRVRREEREKICSQESSRANSPVHCEILLAQPDSTTFSTLEGVPKGKPTMLSVEVQTQTCDLIGLTSSPKSTKDQEKSKAADSKERRSDIKHRSYRSRHARSSSSSSSADSDHHRSRRRKRSSRRSSHRRSSVSRMWSRSPSRSSSRSDSLDSSQCHRSKSNDQRQKWRSRSPHRSNNYRSSNRNFHRQDSHSRDRTWQRSRSPMRGACIQDYVNPQKNRQVEERRVIYVGRIEEGTTKADLRKRFQQFGPIVDISVHFRERGDNYGFVTFAYKTDAYQAVEHGNDDPKLPRYDLCFGGRRAFCKQRYADLDGIASIHSQYGPPLVQQRAQNDSFDLLLHEVKSQLRKRSV